MLLRDICFLAYQNMVVQGHVRVLGYSGAYSEYHSVQPLR
jgi:hypothetical protein